MENVNGSNGSKNELQLSGEHTALPAPLPAPLTEQMSDAEAIHALTGLLSQLRQDVDHAMSAEPPAQA